MFCPKCATKNLDGASFCRSCGANISLVPQALTGQVAQAPVADIPESSAGRKCEKEVTLDQSFRNIFMGIAFLIVAIVLSRTIGQWWWFWMLIPAFMMFSTGLAQYIRIREREKRGSLVAPPMDRAFPERANLFHGEMPSRNPDELMPPAPSVTEGTTRHLGVEAPTRHLNNERK